MAAPPSGTSQRALRTEESGLKAASPAWAEHRRQRCGSAHAGAERLPGQGPGPRAAHGCQLFALNTLSFFTGSQIGDSCWSGIGANDLQLTFHDAPRRTRKGPDLLTPSETKLAGFRTTHVLESSSRLHLRISGTVHCD